MEIRLGHQTSPQHDEGRSLVPLLQRQEVQPVVDVHRPKDTVVTGPISEFVSFLVYTSGDHLSPVRDV